MLNIVAMLVVKLRVVRSSLTFGRKLITYILKNRGNQLKTVELYLS